MKNRDALEWTAPTLLALLLSGLAATATAQTPAPKMSPAKMAQHQDSTKGMKGMHDMMAGPHHVLAMAYRDNLATFARALRGQVTKSKTVNLELAQPAVAEMRRSFDQIQQHHQAQMSMMGSELKPPMPEMMQHMTSHVSALNEHLTALESEVRASAPDPTRVAEHATEILKQCAGMSETPGSSMKNHSMPPKAKPNK